MSNFSLKHPPPFEKDEEYEVWKRDVELWQEFTDLAKAKQAIAVNLCLRGRARVAASEVPIADLKKDDGVQTLLDRLDKVFLLDEGSRQFSVFSEFYKLKKSEGQAMDEFISQFEHVSYKMESQKMKLPDPVTAFMLLESCNFSDSEKKMVMSSLQSVTYDNMKSAIKRIFSETANFNKFAAEVKTEPVFETETEESFYARGNPRWRASSQRGRRRLNSFRRATAGKSGSRKTNPLDKYGNPSRCMICGSKFHWANNCPDSYENNKSFASNEKIEKNNSDDGEDSENEVHLALFGFYAQKKNPENGKLSNLVEECHSCALLDSGCSKTVAGRKWYENYYSDLSDYDKKCVQEMCSDSLFTFGGGVTKKSLKRVILPCYILGKRSTVEADIVDSEIPLLLSRKAMKKGQVVLDFARDIATVAGKEVKLLNTKSGHYLLPLY